MKLTYLLLLLTLFCASSNNVIGQEKKYQSLLWEISGNGLEKNSYIYGTMHVSEKISYHLSTSFFDKILNSDIVATESDPSTWADAGNLYTKPVGFANRQFYSSFYSFPIEKRNLYSLFSGINYNQTNLLSRTDSRLSNYQEDTYLDMFIYRTGRKYGKKCVGLEDAKESLITIQQGRLDARSVDFNIDEQGLSRIQKNKSTQELMQDFYREKDLDMLDSLMKLSTHPKVLEGLLYKRNVTMVKSMDSIMKTGSLFAAVGASHLPGELGMIELLRKMGYIVNPIYSEFNDKGRSTKKEIDEYFLKPSLKLVSSADGMIELPMFNSSTEDGERIESSDLVNGGFINVKRISKRDFLRKDNIKFSPLTLDSLFFENIPGDIIDKKVYIENGNTVYDIVSITKTKKTEHYRYYITPIEIIAVIMGGEGDYVRKFENLVFDNITIKGVSSDMTTYSPKKSGFEINLPSYFKTSGDNEWNQIYDDIEIQGYDQDNDAYFFLNENTATDVTNLFDSKFELERIAYEFIFQLDGKISSSDYDAEKLIYTAVAKIGNKDIQLMTTMREAKYYLLGTVNASEKASNDFFKSFKFTKLSANTELVTYQDNKSHMTIEIPKKYNEFLDLKLDGAEKEWSSKNKFNVFEGEGDRLVFYNPTGEIVELGYYMYGEYNNFKDREEFWKDFKKNVTANYDDEDTIVSLESATDKKRREWDYDMSRWQLDLNEVNHTKNKYSLINDSLTKSDENGVQIFSGLVVKENSVQATKVKAILSDNSFHYIRALVDRDNPDQSEFINRTFTSFKVLPEKKAFNTYEDKVDRYIMDVNSDVDSIHYSAIKSTEYIVINEKNIGKISAFLDEYEFSPEEIDAEFELIRQITAVDQSKGLYYLDRIYKSENVLPSTQIEVLQELAYGQDKKMYQKILSLMEYDLPLSENNRDVDRLFSQFKRNDLSALLFPEILQYYVVPEYQKAVVAFTEYAVTTNLVSARKIKSYKKLLLTNAKLEYKRLAAWKREQDLLALDTYKSSYYGYQRKAPINSLLSYVHILEVFRKDKDISQLFAKIEKLDIEEYYLDQVKTQIKRSNDLDEKLVNRLLENPKTRFSAYRALHHVGKPIKISEDSIAQYAVFQLNDLKTDKDSLTFLEKRDEEYKGLTIRYFFYKLTDIDEESDEIVADKIAGIAFVLDKKGINPQSFLNFRAKKFLEEKEINEFIEISIDESKYNSYNRVNHKKIKSNSRNDYYDDYFEDDFYEDDYYEEEY